MYQIPGKILTQNEGLSLTQCTDVRDMAKLLLSSGTLIHITSSGDLFFKPTFY